MPKRPGRDGEGFAGKVTDAIESSCASGAKKWGTIQCTGRACRTAVAWRLRRSVKAPAQSSQVMTLVCLGAGLPLEPAKASLHRATCLDSANYESAFFPESA